MAKKFFKSAVILAFLAGLGILGHIGSMWIDQKYGEKNRYTLSENLTVIEYKNGEIGILNNSTEKSVGRYDSVLRTFFLEESTHHARIVVKDDLRGYISAQTGDVIFKPQFRYAWIDDPESGLAACVNTDNKLGFVNIQTKEIAIPFQFDYNDDLFSPYNRYYKERVSILDFVFSNGICIFPNKNGKIGIIDKTGKEILPAKYSDIINWRDTQTPTIILKRKPFLVGIGVVSYYSDGYVKIEEIIEETPAFNQGDLKKDDIILKIKPERGSEYIDVFNTSHEDVLNLIRGEKGTEVTLFVKHKNGTSQDVTIIRDEIDYEFSDSEHVYAVCDRDFNMILPFEYDSFDKNWQYDLDYSKISIQNYIVSKDGKYGILDTLFNTILPVSYDYIEKKNDSYLVELDGKQGVLNSDLKTILPIEYDWIGIQYTEFDSNSYKYIAKKDFVQKLYDKKGNILSDLYIEDGENVFEPILESRTNQISPYIKYYLDGYYGIINDSQKAVIPARYDHIEYIGNDIFVCTENEYSFLINTKK